MAAEAPTPDLQPVRRAALHDRVAAELRALIVESRLEPGERLNERLLCQRFGVSRTPLREAYKVLAAEGLVELLPNRGAKVRPLDPAEFRDTVEVMEALERLAGQHAAVRASTAEIAEIGALHGRMMVAHEADDRRLYLALNQEIHLAIVAAARNAVLEESYLTLNARLRRYRYFAGLGRERWVQSAAEHALIQDRLVARDGPGLAEILGRHLRNKVTQLSEHLSRAAAESG